MSYVKLHTVVADFALGYQTMSQAGDNCDALKDVLDAEHALGNSGFNTSSYTNPLNEVGRHDDNLIARTVAHCYVDNTSTTPTLLTYFSGPAIGALNYVRRAAGQWQIFIQAPHEFFGIASLPAAGSVDYQARTYRVVDPTYGPSLIVSTWSITGGNWALTDLDFDVALWLRR